MEKRILKINKRFMDKMYYVGFLEYDVYKMKLYGVLGINGLGEEEFYMDFNNSETDYGFMNKIKKDANYFKKCLDLFYLKHVITMTVPTVDKEGILHLDKEIHISK